MNAADELARGRACYAQRSWMAAYKALSHADHETPLAAEDLELLATSAYLVGRDDDLVSALVRAHHWYLDAGQTPPAVRCAFWIGIDLALRSEMAPAVGWFGRAQRLLDREQFDCVERGYLMLPAVIQSRAGGDHQAAYAAAAGAAELGERFGDADLVALAVHEQGRALVGLGRMREGLGLLDEAMVAVTADELSPIVTGLVYCSVIEGCLEVHELRRAHEWTTAMTRWCGEQPDMVAFAGQCLVMRAGILQLHGAWREALDEARRACERFGQGMNRVPAAQAFYRQGEVYRLQGKAAEAEDAYRDSSRDGWEPQPGLALLRLAQGNDRAAAAAIRRALGETTPRAERLRLLPAYVEIMLSVGEVEPARVACREIEEISHGGHPSGMLVATAATASGAVELADGAPGAALPVLRRAWNGWQELDVPYEAARVRVLLGLACRALGDDDSAELELAAAREVFRELGAAPDLARLDRLAEPAGDSVGLTARELEVLRLIAAGLSTRAIAADLVLSERTVDRHVSNVFTKLGVSSRAAATAYAYRHRLLR
jgi:DNA-binding CsgD family transcriptional regulator